MGCADCDATGRVPCGSCDGSAEARVKGGKQPYTYKWSYHDTTSQSVAPLPGGDYSVTVTDATGCTKVATGAVYQYESTGRMSQDQVVVGLSNRPNKHLSFFARYYLTRARSDTDGAATFPADSLDLVGEYGPAANDARHRLVLGGSILREG